MMLVMLIGHIGKQDSGLWPAMLDPIGAYTQGRSVEDAIAQLVRMVSHILRRPDATVTATVIRSHQNDGADVLIECSIPAVLTGAVLKDRRQRAKLSVSELKHELAQSGLRYDEGFEDGTLEPSVAELRAILEVVAPEMALTLTQRRAATSGG